jgi:hypothetical protein
MISWYHDHALKGMMITLCLGWLLFLLLAPIYFPFLLVHIYLPFFYPLLMVIFLTLQSRHPHLFYLFELRKTYPYVLFKQMSLILYQLTMSIGLIMIIHCIVFISYDIPVVFSSFLMLNMSTLYIFGLFHPITTPLFYKLFGFMMVFLGHHFLLDIDVYETFTFLYKEPSNHVQTLILWSGYIVIQIIHYIAIEKKAL